MMVFRMALSILSLAWLAAVQLRAWAYRAGILRRRALQGTVLSVGNLTTGGTGKTPMVLWLMERLAAEHKEAAVLTRGYRGFLQGCKSLLSGAIFSAADAPDRLPDEVNLLARRLGNRQPSVPAAWFGVGSDRCALGRELEQRGVRWFVLDDGFQHLRLTRDADIVLVDAKNPFNNGMLLPAGRLREPITALRRAGVVVITRSDSAPALEALIARRTSAPMFYAQTRLDGIFPADAPGEAPSAAPGDELPVTKSQHERLFAFCGIGNSRAFFDDAGRWGLNLCGELRFPDHHRYSSADANTIEDRALAAQATALLCTEKDICNLDAAAFGRIPLYYARISLHLPEAEKFWRAVLDAVERRRKGVAK